MANPGESTIHVGATGRPVRRLQRALRRTPSLSITVDGTFSPQLEASVKAFQEGAGLTADGIVGPLTWAALPDGRPMPLLKEGASGDVVRELQRVLTNGASEWGTSPQGVDEHFGPRTKASVTASGDNTARIWDAASGKQIAVLKGHAGPVNSAAFSADGMRVVTASGDNTARIWDAASGKQIAVLKGHAGPVNSAAFSADGMRVVTASWDRTARIWDAASGKQIAVLKGHAGPVRSAVFSAEGRRVVTASLDNTARIWDVTWATLVRGNTLRERVCAEKLIGAAQEFSADEMDDPILRGIDKDDPVARNPCLRRGPLSLDYWTQLSGWLWRSTHRLVGLN